MKPNWFVALPVAAADWFAPMINNAPETLRRFHADDLHLTVAFLGACGEEGARAAWAVAEGLPLPEFEATLGGLVPMGNRKKPSAIAVALEEGRGPVAEYMTCWRGALLAAAGARPDARPAKPHITIGRPPRGVGPEERAAIVEWGRAHPPIDVKIRLDELAIYTWSEDRTVRQFKAIQRR